MEQFGATLTPEFHLDVLENALLLLSEAIANARACGIIAEQDHATLFAISEAPIALSEASEALSALRLTLAKREESYSKPHEA